MDREYVNRIKEAKKYQKMAVYALLPESAGKHLEVIGKEVSAMLNECFMDLVKQEARKMAEEKWQDTASSEADLHNGKKTGRKVQIN